MKITDENNLCGSERKGALAEAVSKFQSDHAALHARYVGHRFDAAYRREIERMEGELGESLRASMPVMSMQDAAALISLECMLLREFEGDKPEGIHGTRLAGLEAVRAFLLQLAAG